jgi:uncharacterized protein YbjT (DUF2867 family)
VVQQLLASGFKVRAFVHSADKAKALSEKGVEAIIRDFDSPTSLQKAVDGVSTVFLLTPLGEKADVLARNAIVAAKGGRQSLYRPAIRYRGRTGCADCQHSFPWPDGKGSR